MGTLCAQDDFRSSKKPRSFVKKLWMRAIACGKRWKTRTKFAQEALRRRKTCRLRHFWRAQKRGNVVSRRLCRIAASEFQQETVCAMNEAGFRKEHERAMSFHHLNTMLLAKGYRLRTHCSLAAGAIDPDFADACLDAVLHYADRFIERRHDQRALDRGFHNLQVLKTFLALDLVG